MNILHINQSDLQGGAAIAGYRLHQGLFQNGINSRLLVGRTKTDDENIDLIPSHLRLENQLRRFTKRLGLNCIHHVNSFKISQHTFYENADILNFHNLHSTRFSYLAIPELTQSKPAIFTLHDMWSFTGHCAYSFDCSRWKIGCGKCPYPDTYPKIQRDNTYLEWKLKKWVYSRSNPKLTIVTPSQWLAEQAQQSILNRFAIHHIPYGIDTEAYQPLEKHLCRKVLGIPTQKKVLMFGAASLKDSRKGGDLLVKALSLLPESLKTEIHLLTIGNDGNVIAKAINLSYSNLGYVTSDRLKSIAYSAADLFLFPTRADNLPVVLQESMACGLPMVSFNIGGVPELVRAEETGYLAKAENCHDFCQGLVKLLQDFTLRTELSANCRAIAVTEYSLDLQAQRYIDLYKKILK